MNNTAISFYSDHTNNLDLLAFNAEGNVEMFDAIQTFITVYRKNKDIFFILLGKIQDSLEKYHILMLNMSINSYKLLLHLGIEGI